jgi:hypothetical protein
MDSNPLEAPRTTGPSSATHPDKLYVRGGVVFAPIVAALPEICAACGSDDVITSDAKRYSWTPLWARMTILLSPFVALAAILLTRKTSTLTVSLCASDSQRIQRNTRVGWGGLLGGVGLIVASVVFVDSLAGGFFVVLGTGVAAFFVAIWGFSQAMVVKPKYIDKTEARYAGIHPDVLAAIDGGSA